MNHPLTTLFLLPLLGFAAGAVYAADDEPLMQASAYTLGLNRDMLPNDGFFPLSILNDGEMNTLPRIGYTFTDGGGHRCSEFRTGAPCRYSRKVSPRSPVFVSLWAAHTVFGNRQTKHYGLLKNSVAADGKPHTHHNLNLHDDATRRYVLDCEKASVAKVVEVNGDRVFLWHLDNEWEMPLDYSPEARAAFVKFARARYRDDLAMFNQVWNAQYAAFEEFVPPTVEEASKRSGAWLDWRRFQEEIYTDFMAARFRNVATTDPMHRPVVFKGTQCTLAMPAVAKIRVNNHEMMANKTRAWSHGWYGIDIYGNGDSNTLEYNYFYNAIRSPADPADRSLRYGIFAAETNNHSGPGWQFAQSYWRVLGNGVKGFDFFTLGKKGAAGDWATFGFTRTTDGVRNDKFYYAARLGAMIHRTEKFWAESQSGLSGGVAMLLPFRDVQLSEPSGVSRWDYPQNDFRKVYTHLREAGFHVDLLPYGKLNDAWLKRYAALVLVGADHLAPAESDAIRRFVEAGGTLLADGQTGFFDDLHREVRALEPVLGVAMGKVYKGIDVSPDDLWLDGGDGESIRSDGKITAKTTTAQLLNADRVANSLKVPMLTSNRFGRGTAFWINTRLGCMRAEGPSYLVGTWLRNLLGSAGVKPQTVFLPTRPELRAEPPMTDADGNTAVIFANTIRRPAKPTTVELKLPRGDYRKFYWAEAESTTFRPIAVQPLGDRRYRLALPELATAAVLFAEARPIPMLGIEITGAPQTVPNDRWTPLAAKGGKLTVRVRFANAPAGAALRLRGFQDWTITPREVAAAGDGEAVFEVELPRTSPQYQPEQPCPLLAELSTNDKRLAVCNAVVAVE